MFVCVQSILITLNSKPCVSMLNDEQMRLDVK